VATVHPTALVEPGAELDRNVQVGPYTIIGGDVRLGARTVVGSHTVLEGSVDVGADCRIGSHVVIGAPPQDLKYGGEPTRVTVGEGSVVREFATVHRASVGGNGVTSVGAHAYLMAYVHVAHNCRVGEHVIMANQASLAGHVEIGQHALVGAMTGVHQFVRIGDYAFVGACSAVVQDVPPYVMAVGDRAKPYGLNVVGLRRHGFSSEVLRALKEAYRLVFAANLNTSQALAQFDAAGQRSPEVQLFIDFIKRSQRGICK
jgi:UDP-N-acetylglucosamine acyltransferase